MLLAIKKNQSFYIAHFKSENTLQILLAKHMSRLLDNQHSDLLVEIMELENTDTPVYKNFSESQFTKLRHEEHTLHDPQGLFDSVTTYNPVNYILFDMDEDKILVPDVTNFSDDCYLYETRELDDLFAAYKYSIGAIYNLPVNLAIKQNWIILSSERTDHFTNGTLIRSSMSIRENKPLSSTLEVSYCYCCGTFSCNCPEETIEEFCDGLPF
ncbi:hypothetical protein ACQWTT_001133 [Acinetobacter baumannii]